MRSGRGFEGTRDLAARGRKEMPARQNGVHALGLVDAQRRCRVHARPRLWCPALPCCEDAAALSPSLSPLCPPPRPPPIQERRVNAPHGSGQDPLLHLRPESVLTGWC